jgi:hypothetical protein
MTASMICQPVVVAGSPSDKGRSRQRMRRPGQRGRRAEHPEPATGIAGDVREKRRRARRS